ncbi:tyrosine--tRNA ligase [Oceanobacillus alkalisoli]|uniref:tyrosine--tRNA ligase n=1 Tax=Oceanobacillus alkalisoli TaxID=2925113 RepID=UPI001EEF94D0|nr:tyrosine--tRNA ligase [Oceanobacillus alkalisoli]MCF3943298.1 tyrosine--tRNA ligase [Oceanobacillus alkalisoli]MCG5103825.1 tyrosine--tRNA ligase [Oceanobacillus alkalisoli]
MNILEELEWRGLINQVTDREGLEELLNKQAVTLYCGFDPTADSLHIGHLVPIVMLKRFQKAGHKPIALVGGGTGMIGDPSGRSAERSLNTADVVMGYANSIQEQIGRLVKFGEGENPVVSRNNHDWLSKITFIDVLRDAGKHFSINYMLAKESVSSRIESGITYTEFSYMLLQSIDYMKLYEEENCQLQIGGSDQWGNITAGMEMIRRTRENPEEEEVNVFGLTVPLITKADGTKFGKTAGNAIWLDPEKTTPYEFYQFWLNTDDRDVVKFLQYFTFLSKEEIEALEKEVETQPEKRVAQRRLAEEMTKMVHSEEALEQAIRISEALFSGNIKELSVTEIEQGFKDVPTHNLDKEDIELVDLLVQAKISPSKRQAREDISNGAIYINGERQQEVGYTLTADDRIEDVFTIIRRGKKKYTLIDFS